MYSNAVLNLFNNPKNAGRISKPDGIADCYNEDGTSHVEFSLRIESGVITESKFRAQANPYIVAICSTITQMLKGKMVSMVFLDQYSIKSELGDENSMDINFCIECVKLAILDFKEKNEKGKKRKIDEEVETSETAEDFIEEVEIAPTLKLEEEKIETSSSDEDDDFADFFDDIFDEED